MKSRFLLLSIIITLLSFCLMSTAYAQERAKLGVPLPIYDSNTPEGAFNSRVIFLADQLFRNKKTLPDKPIMITSFLNLDNLSETNPLGRLIAEALIHEMQVRNFRVIDFRLTEKLFLTESSEVFLSRDPKRIKEKYEAAYVLTGSYTKTRNGWFINARIIDLSTSEVVSSAQAIIPGDIYPPPPPPPPPPLPTVRIVGAQ